METQKLPVGSRFRPTKLGLVRRLRNMVMCNNSDFITTLDVYNDEPWLLDHVNNDLFYENKWYYFVPRTKRGGKTTNRTVPGRGESEGGKWKGTGRKKEAIIDERNNRVEGYKQTLVYNKIVKGKQVKTDWLMTEYSLHMDVHDDLVLCKIRDETKKRLKLGFVNQVPPSCKNNILSNQVREEEANGLVEKMTLEGEHGDVTQQQQQQQDTPIFPPLLQGHDSGFETMMMTTQSNDNNIMMMSYQEQYQWDDFGFDGSADLMLNVDELIAMEVDVSQQQQQQQLHQLIPQAQDPRRFVGQVMFTSN